MSAGGIAGIHYLEPGIDGIVATEEAAVSYGDNRFFNFFKLSQALISGAARDLGNPAGSTFLRSGLLMTYIAATDRWSHFLHGDMTGLEVVHGMLFATINTQKDGANQDRFVGAIVFGGLWRSEGIVVSDALNTGRGLTGATGEATARASILASMNLVRLSDAHEQ